MARMIRRRTLLGLGIGLLAPHAVSQTVPVPSVPVPTGLQSPVPAPRFPIPSGSSPLAVSPALPINLRNPITIDNAVAIALSTNRAYATAAASLLRSMGRVSEARAMENPQVGVNGTITQYQDPVVAQFGPQSITLTNRFNPIFEGLVSLPIDISGSTRAAVSQAQFQEVAARIDVNRTRNQLVYDVRSAFYQALRQQGQRVVAEDNLVSANLRLADVQKLLAVGMGSQFDVITAQRDVADAQLGLVSAKAQVALALANLKNTMGINVSAPIELTDQGAVTEPEGVVKVAVPTLQPGPNPLVPLPPPPGGTPPIDAKPPDIPFPPDPGQSPLFHRAASEIELGPQYESAVAEAIRTRPEVLESEASLTAAQRGVVYARRSLFPTISVNAGYVLQPNAAGFTPMHQGSVGLSFNVPIYEGGLARAREEQARAEEAAARVNQRSAVDQVTFDVQTAYISLIQARERVQVANVGLAQATVAFRMARLRAQTGVSATPQISPQLELSNAQVSLTQAESNRVNALYDFNLARTQLDRAIGRYSYGPGAGYPTVPPNRETGRAG